MKIYLTGADNARDFCGITNKNGLMICSRGMIRSNHLHTLTEKDKQILRDTYHLKKVIDLRTNMEAEQKPDEIIEGVEYIHIPIFNERAIGITHEIDTDMQAAGLADIPDMEELYVKMVKDEECTLQISKVLKEIMNNEDGAVLWHCTEGKDRCGIISALVLAMLGVGIEDIKKDYIDTNLAAEKRAEVYYENVMLKTGDKEKAECVKNAFMASENFINAALDYINAHYSSVTEYIQERLNISEEAMEKFQEKIFNTERLDKQFQFSRELDKEKFIKRQTYLSDGVHKENDAEHAWHMAVMALILGEYSNEKIDLLRTISMILIHDVVEIDAGDTYAYDEEGKKTQEEREKKAADRLFGMLPEEQGRYFKELWHEFEERKTPEAKFARTMDCIQPLMLNDATDGKSWVEHGVHLSQVLNRNRNTSQGSEVLWNYVKENFIEKNVKNGKLVNN